MGAAERVVCDRYGLLEELGSGAMGTVWRAWDERLQRQVAVKEVRLPAAIPADERDALHARALREARAAARLSHPAAVTIFDVQQEEGRAYLVMELVDAPTLADVLARDGVLSHARAAAIGVDVLAALEAAHSAGIVHRDVKPANVMLPTQGPAKLTDFGIASLKDDPKITQTGLILGSPSYMAPEQADGRGGGPRSDLWALGATLYYAVEGAAPFDEGAAIPTLAAVMHDPPRAMTSHGPLEEVITALLAKSPTARPSHVEARGMLEEVASGTARPRPQPTSPPPDAAVAEESVVARPSRARRWTTAVAVLAVVALLAVAGLAWFAATGEDDPGDRARPRAAGGRGEERTTEEDTADTDTSTGEVPGETDVEGGLPVGWVVHEEPTTGHSIAYPESWEVVAYPIDDSSTDFRDPASGAYLRLDWTSPPGPSAVGAWEAQETDFAADHEGYQRLALEPTTYRGYEAATWEFTWQEGDTTLHAVDLGFIVGDDYGYALNMVAPEPLWDDYQDEFALFQDTFQPPS